MTPGLLPQLVYVAAVIGIPAVLISLLAMVSVNRRAPRFFIYSVLVTTCVAAIAVAVAMRGLSYSGRPSVWHNLLGAFLSWAPLFLLPSAFVWICVTGSLSKRWIPILATLGVVLSLPVGFILGLLVQ